MYSLTDKNVLVREPKIFLQGAEFAGVREIRKCAFVDGASSQPQLLVVRFAEYMISCPEQPRQAYLLGAVQGRAMRRAW